MPTMYERETREDFLFCLKKTLLFTASAQTNSDGDYGVVRSCEKCIGFIWRMQESQFKGSGHRVNPFHHSSFKTISNTRDGFDQISITIELFTDLSDMHIDRSIHNVDILSPHRIEDRLA
jgi:hypothetical protein